ncbi:MAG: polyphenol oxidase family protein [Chthoniobacteraceae bacterium]
MSAAVPSETFPALELPFIRHAFLGRVPGLDVSVEREEALRRLDGYHTRARRDLGFGTAPFAKAEQVHGNQVAMAAFDSAGPAPQADGLVTSEKNLTLGIYVADCCAIYLADPVRRAIGLLHSGRKGTELGIVTVAIEKMRAQFGSDPVNLIVQLGPCIRPPDYEIDFAAQIAEQCRVAGVRHVFDCGSNTAADLSRYYSYRVERGKTGRMLALMELI